MFLLKTNEHVEMDLKWFSHLHRSLVLAHLQDSFAPSQSPMLAIYNGCKMLYRDDLPNRGLTQKMAWGHES